MGSAALQERCRVLYRKWENDIGDQITNQVVLPDTLRQTAFEAHHSHITASYRGARKTISALQTISAISSYWPGLTSAVHRLVASCHVCGSKKMWGKKRRAPLQQYVVSAAMERIAIDILSHCHKLRGRTSLYWWLVMFH